MAGSSVAALKPVKEWAPKHFHTRHELICKLHACGLRNKEIAQALGLTESRISIILNDPRAAEYIRDMVEEVADRYLDMHASFKAIAPQMFKIVTDIASDPEAPAGVRSRNAFELLDRAGYGAVEKHEHAIAMQLSDKQVEQLANARKELPNDSFSYEVEDAPDVR